MCFHLIRSLAQNVLFGPNNLNVIVAYVLLLHWLKNGLRSRKEYQMAQHEAQLITDGLFLGPHQVAQSREALEGLQVNSVLSVLGENQDFDKVAVPPQNKIWVQVTDRVEAEDDMRAALPDAVQQLGAWDVEEKKTLVHCQSGISRSATVVIAFMMKHRGMKLMEAYRAVWERRPAINPNDGFFRVLQDYEMTHCGVTKGEGGRDADTREYNAFQLVSQLAFAGLTLQQCRDALVAADGDVQFAASSLLESTGM